MQSVKNPEPLDMGFAARSRSTSMSSDSQLPRMNLFAPPPVNPPPAFIASSAAAQIITADQEFNTADFVGEDDSGTALVRPAALNLLNGFLDHLLFNILAAAKSTQLAQIRPAIADVLKPRLAREVVSAADDELSEYMGGVEDEQFDFRSGQEPAEFDLIRSWKSTRLRCMVYTRLGDMEEDDEDEYIVQDGLTNDEASPRFTSHVGNITPAAAIFLTSIMEYLGERGLVIAGETARSRLASRLGAEHDEVTESGAERGSMNRLVVEDFDMEKLALNGTLGRLWRTWRSRLRTHSLSRTGSRESFMRRNLTSPTAGSRKSSIITVDEIIQRPVEESLAEDAEEEEVDPAAIPLPLTEHDVKEIEIPNFHADLEGPIQTMEAVLAHKVRPRSLMVLCSPSSPRSPGSYTSSPITPIIIKGPRHARSRSLPNAAYDAQNVPQTAPDAEKAERPPAQASPTPSEERRRLETMYEHDEAESVTPQVGVAITKGAHEGETAEPQTVDTSVEKSVSNTTPEPVASPLSDTSMQVAVSRPSSAQVSAEYAGDRQLLESEEVIEGRGTCEKPPKMVSIQRPKRKSSRDPTRREDRSISSSLASEPAVQTVVEDQPSEQGVDTPLQPTVADDNASNKPAEAVPPSTASPVPQTFLSNDDDDDADSVAKQSNATTDILDTSRPVSASGESARSERSRTRPKPSPLSLTSNNLNVQGRSSPTVTSPGTERAAVQRLHSRPSTSMASSVHSKSRRSDSFSSAREKRPVTAGSTTSQVSNKLKGLMNRPQGDSNSMRLRSSSDTSRQSGESGDSAGLEKLLKSDETIHFTLTPQSMREMELPDTPRWKANRSSTAELADFLKNTGPPGEEPSPRPRTSNTSSRGTIDLPSVSKSKSIDSSKAKPIHKGRLSISKAKAGLARDARSGNAGSSTREFADFLKSTGPDGPVTPRSVPDRAQSPRSRRLSDATVISKKFSRPASALSKEAGSTKSARLQARPAAVPKSEQTSDLIDFIREGPPVAGAHRIPRTVAPFRSTMDSDDLQSLEANTEKDMPAVSVTSTQDGSMATKSHTSMGSRTGLLESASRANVQAPKVQAPASSSTDFDDPFPVRKQRRVPDPYAIDDDEEDELEELLEPQKPKREEESLIDFLRNAPPPPMEEEPPQPFAVDVSAYKNSNSNTFSSASAMKARFLRTSSNPALKSTSRQQPANNNSNYAVKVGQERGGAQVHVTHDSPTASSPPPISSRQTETSSLADFLRNTGPPEPPPRAGSSLAGSRKDSSNSLTRLFNRRKKIEV